ncbi:gas vesicle protein GvpJ [Streptomyces sp. NPDC057582]|uniref:gas vesicle protein GvpJ n=1 Tax=unclassified Streptomyces TaxID=2593676 RepID=UPI00368D4ADE
MTTYSDEVVCAPRAGTLYDVLELILDRGMVIDVFVRVSLVGIEILKVDARIVVASVDTYLRFAEACNRLDLDHDTRSTTVPELLGGGLAKSVGKAGARSAAKSIGGKVKETLGIGEDSDHKSEEEAEESRPRRRSAPRRAGERPRARSRRTAEEE